MKIKKSILKIKPFKKAKSQHSAKPQRYVKKDGTHYTLDGRSDDKAYKGTSVCSASTSQYTPSGFQNSNMTDWRSSWDADRTGNYTSGSNVDGTGMGGTESHWNTDGLEGTGVGSRIGHGLRRGPQRILKVHEEAGKVCRMRNTASTKTKYYPESKLGSMGSSDRIDKLKNNPDVLGDEYITSWGANRAPGENSLGTYDNSQLTMDSHGNITGGHRSHGMRTGRYHYSGATKAPKMMMQNNVPVRQNSYATYY